MTTLGLKASWAPAPTVMGILVARVRGRRERRARGRVGYMMLLMLLCLLACFGVITSAFADWLEAKSDETQGNSG